MEVEQLKVLKEMIKETKSSEKKIENWPRRIGKKIVAVQKEWKFQEEIDQVQCKLETLRKQLMKIKSSSFVNTASYPGW